MKQIVCFALCTLALAGWAYGQAADDLAGAQDYIVDIVTRTPSILRTWESIVPSSYTNELWIKELQGISSPVQQINIDQKPFYLGDVCKPHNCGDDDIVFLIAVDGSEVYGMLSSKSLNAGGFFGSPNPERQQVMAKKMTEEFDAPSPQPKESTDVRAQIDAVVKLCVGAVHAQYQNSGFDAFYNPANGTVQNNVAFLSQQQALLTFEKCMAENGFPPGPAAERH